MSLYTWLGLFYFRRQTDARETSFLPLQTLTTSSNGYGYLTTLSTTTQNSSPVVDSEKTPSRYADVSPTQLPEFKSNTRDDVTIPPSVYRGSDHDDTCRF